MSIVLNSTPGTNEPNLTLLAKLLGNDFHAYYEPNPELSAGGWSSIDTANNAFVVGANGLLMAKHLGVLGFV